MDALTVAVAAVVAIVGQQGISALLRLRHDKKIGVRTTDIAAADQRDTAQDRLVQRLMARVESLEGRLDEVERKRREDARVIRAQGDHIDVLEDWVWKRTPPPPPPRPQTA